MSYIYLYDPHSESGLALAKALDLKVIRHVNSKFKGSFDKKVLNWGCSDLPLQVRRSVMYNEERSVDWAINKIKSFTRMQEWGTRTVPWTTDINVARRWLTEGSRVFGRRLVKGKDGEGLVECKANDPMNDIKLWTKFIVAQKEYRVNVVQKETEPGIFRFAYAVQRKVPLDGFNGQLNPDIKTSGNGYGFKFVTRNIPQDVLDEASRALIGLGLDFGGVDVLWDGERAYVLEVNTAPQFTPRVIETLTPAFKEMLGLE